VLVCNAASNPYYGPLGGISDDQFRKILDNNMSPNNWLISMWCRDDRAQGRLDHHRLLDRRAEGLTVSAPTRSRRRPTCSSRATRLRIRQAQYPRELHRAGLIKTNFAKALWTSETLKASTAALAAAAHRHPRRDRRRGRVHGSAAGDFMTGQTIVIDGGSYDQFEDGAIELRHGRACPGHPRTSRGPKGVDAGQAGHDEK